eukprot:scaffold30636_cov129-Isochrysis_galbana.AAC.1
MLTAWWLIPGGEAGPSGNISMVMRSASFGGRARCGSRYLPQSTSASGRPRLQTAAPQLELRRPPDRGAAAAPSLEFQWRRRSRPPGERSAPALTHGCRCSACAPTTPDAQPPHPSRPVEQVAGRRVPQRQRLRGVRGLRRSACTR